MPNESFLLILAGVCLVLALFVWWTNKNQKKPIKVPLRSRPEPTPSINLARQAALDRLPTKSASPIVNAAAKPIPASSISKKSSNDNVTIYQRRDEQIQNDQLMTGVLIGSVLHSSPVSVEPTAHHVSHTVDNTPSHSSHSSNSYDSGSSSSYDSGGSSGGGDGGGGGGGD